MPRRITAEMKCARCGRLWYADYDVVKGDIDCVSLEMVLKSGTGQERKVSFDAICGICTKAIVNYIDQIDRDMKKASPQRRTGARKTPKEVQASPPAPPPQTPTLSLPGTPAVASALLASSPAKGAPSAPVPSTTRVPQTSSSPGRS